MGGIAQGAVVFVADAILLSSCDAVASVAVMLRSYGMIWPFDIELVVAAAAALHAA